MVTHQGLPNLPDLVSFAEEANLRRGQVSEHGTTAIADWSRGGTLDLLETNTYTNNP